MPENTSSATELTSQYVHQVAGDLEQNVKEQDRVSGDIAALQEQLATLQRDHTILVSMQQALGVATTAGAVTEPAVPAPRKKSATASTRSAPETGKRRGGKASAASGTGKPAAKKTATRTVAKASAKTSAGSGAKAGADADTKPAAGKAASPAAQPTLVELVRGHLAQQSEPRSAAEVAEALTKAHPDREIQTKVIRTTLENLVARNSAQRTKQGTSVFYTVPDTKRSEQAEDGKAAESPAG
ncbi:hypothetical protein NX794_30040 [Streptomyces sp. LP11]|uniref:Regulatory protein n=1 Tax=Streptomyces pyxinicus TaxID=2970331 RepID=A0ABT2BA67_9ACTN|nr:hypothetical protein [Streptomyces sp. LP11]MCS0605413.1 hypothetical protein [Streptomyces sp. LP11]